MTTDDTHRDVLFLDPRPHTAAEREMIRARLRAELPRLRRLIESVEVALSGPDPEAAFVFLGILSRASSALLFPG